MVLSARTLISGTAVPFLEHDNNWIGSIAQLAGSATIRCLAAPWSHIYQGRAGVRGGRLGGLRSLACLGLLLPLLQPSGPFITVWGDRCLFSLTAQGGGLLAVAGIATHVLPSD